MLDNADSEYNELPISVYILAKNEALSIEACLDSVAQFRDVVVVDSGSTDDTCHIAEARSVKTIQFRWNGKYPKKKQWMLDNVDSPNDWALLLDADERISPDLLRELKCLVPSLLRKECAAYDISLDYVFNGRVLRHGHRVVKRSLLDRTRARFLPIDDLECTLGEVEGHYQPVVDGAIGKLSGRIIHEDQDPVGTWFERHNRYSDWEAFLLTQPNVAEQVNSMRSAQGRRFRKIPFKPLAFFIYDYVVRGGFRDGRAGLNYAIAQSWYYWLVGVKERELIAKREDA